MQSPSGLWTRSSLGRQYRCKSAWAVVEFELAVHNTFALSRAWAWQRKLESGETVQDLARAENVTITFVSSMTRLAYLSPDVLERLAVWREPPAVSLKTLIEISYLPWAEQMGRVFDQPQSTVENSYGHRG